MCEKGEGDVMCEKGEGDGVGRDGAGRNEIEVREAVIVDSVREAKRVVGFTTEE